MWVKLFVSFLLFCVVGHSKEAPKNTTTVQETPSYRLSNTTEPISYELWLETRINEGIFDYTGRVKIAIKAIEATDVITMHAFEIEIHNYTLTDLMNNPVEISFGVADEIRRTITFTVNSALILDEIYILDIYFSGILRRVPNGFCYCSFVEENGDISLFATSHTHVSNGRRIFPCYDEPGYRTPFTIHLTHHPSFHSRANSPVSKVTVNSNDSVTTTFERTLPMPVNLLAFTISKHAVRTKFIEALNLNLSLFVPQQHIEEVEFAMDFISFILQMMNKTLDMDIQLTKLDGISINDLLLTGLENWGLIFFNPKNFLYKENSTNPSQKMDISRTMAHQLIHSYFGNLVGMPWWNLFWMTEGFATYLEYYFTSYYLEDFPLNDVFVCDFMQRYFADHSLQMSKPLNEYSDRPEDVVAVFNLGMISKAGSIIRMMHHFLGEKTFMKGLQKYLKEMKFKSAEEEDLYRNLQEAIDEDEALPKHMRIGDILDTWISQAGYPLLTVTRNYQSNEIVVNQQRFLSSPEEADTDGLSWYIPLTISTASSPNTAETKPWKWLESGTRELVLTATENKTWNSEEWVLFNVQQSGYYRVNYDAQNWRLLANELNQGSPFAISTINRAQIIDDSFNLAYSDIVPFTLALEIIKYIRFEPDYAVWISANRHLLTLNRRLDGPSYELYFGRFLKHLTEDHFEKLDVFENINGEDTNRNTFLRPIIVDLACRSGSGMCLTATRIMVTAEALTGHRLTPNEKPAVYYCHGLRNADAKTFNYFWTKLKTIKNEQERSHIATSLSCYEDYESVYLLLLELANPQFYDLYTSLERFQILITAVRYGNSKVVMNFLKENHETIAKTFTFNNRMEQTIRELAENLLEDEASLFHEVIDILYTAGHMSYNQVMRTMIDMNYHQTWIRENKNEIEGWIREFFEPASANAVRQIVSSTILILGFSINFRNILAR
ncbi:aminopeptidase N-like [Lutzomyia longipalpis]|uniref:aminopeptidase N-like n=1 Tax=Lutzomyia longipalpis TaxID=7200 RepID=UPI0024839562|nr:aminopeptidase N-like [Lutzomyia longipalpis]